jgi:hypothetical protein
MFGVGTDVWGQGCPKPTESRRSKIAFNLTAANNIEMRKTLRVDL